MKGLSDRTRNVVVALVVVGLFAGLFWAGNASGRAYQRSIAASRRPGPDDPAIHQQLDRFYQTIEQARAEQRDLTGQEMLAVANWKSGLNPQTISNHDEQATHAFLVVFYAYIDYCNHRRSAEYLTRYQTAQQEYATVMSGYTRTAGDE